MGPEEVTVEPPFSLQSQNLASVLVSGKRWNCSPLPVSRGSREGTVANLSLVWGLKEDHRHHDCSTAMKWTSYLRERELHMNVLPPIL